MRRFFVTSIIVIVFFGLNAQTNSISKATNGQPILINSGLDGSLGLRVYYDMQVYNTISFTAPNWSVQGSIGGLNNKLTYTATNGHSFVGNMAIGNSNPANNSALTIGDGNTHRGDIWLQNGNGNPPVISLADGSKYYNIYNTGGSLTFRDGSDGNTDRLVINTIGNIGIGTPDPGFKLDVRGDMRVGDGITTEQDIYYQNNTGNWQAGVNNAGNGTSGNQFYIYDNSYRFTVQKGTGNIGVGNTTPSAKFTIQQSGDGWNDGLRINRDIINYLTLTEDGSDIRLKNWGTAGIRFFTSTTEALTIVNSGNVGIGTTNPGEFKLAVAGKIRATEIQVDALPWPDFVFTPNYNLRTLTEVENFITRNQHLPDVPSQAQVEAEGISLGEMNAILLQKIEELTLYAIEQEKKIENVKAENLVLKLKNSERNQESERLLKVESELENIKEIINQLSK